MFSTLYCLCAPWSFTLTIADDNHDRHRSGVLTDNDIDKKLNLFKKWTIIKPYESLPAKPVDMFKGDRDKGVGAIFGKYSPRTL